MKTLVAFAIALLVLVAAFSVFAQDTASSADASLRVYVIRHASAWKNVPSAQRPHAMSDAELDSLTPKGLTRAAALGRELGGHGIAAVYCSPANRARQTAAAIAKGLGLGNAIPDAAFRTLDTGPDRAAASGTVRMKSWKTGKDPRPPGGESLGDGFARASAELAVLREKYAGRAIALVTHGEISATLLAKAAGQDILRGYFDHFPNEGSVHVIEVAPDGSLHTVK
jgi:broad specificity phosphatase PhoE